MRMNARASIAYTVDLESIIFLGWIPNSHGNPRSARRVRAAQKKQNGPQITQKRCVLGRSRNSQSRAGSPSRVIPRDLA